MCEGPGRRDVVTAAELLSAAVFAEGKHAQAFPSFGSERTGAPVLSYCRIDYKPIRQPRAGHAPEVLISQDPTLSLFEGAGDDALLLINSGRPAARGFGICAAECPCGAIDIVPSRI